MGTVSGSWEDLFEQAVRSSEHADGEAEARFEKLITRLNKLSDKALIAGDGYLVGLRNRAVAEYAQHLLDADRADEALALILREDHRLSSLDAHGWGRLHAHVLTTMGRADEAAEVWVALAGGDEDLDTFVANADPEQLQESIVALIALRHFAAAAELLRVFDAIVAEDGAEPNDYEPIVALRTLLFASINRPDATAKSFAHLLKLEPSYVSMADQFLAAGWRAGFTTDDLLRLTELRAVKKANLPTAGWWRAFAYAESGKDDLAFVEWREIASDKVLHDLETQPENLWVYTVAQYFLGDPKSLGLAAVLDALRAEGAAAPWTAHAATALGWAMQGDLGAMRLNMLLATEHYWQSTSLSRQLPQPWRSIAKRLVPPEVFATLEGQLQDRTPLQVEEIDL